MRFFAVFSALKNDWFIMREMLGGASIIVNLHCDCNCIHFVYKACTR